MRYLLRNDGFQYAFISLGNKIGMAIGTSVLAVVLYFYRLNKKAYKQIVQEIQERKKEEQILARPMGM